MNIHGLVYRIKKLWVLLCTFENIIRYDVWADLKYWFDHYNMMYVKVSIKWYPVVAYGATGGDSFHPGTRKFL